MFECFLYILKFYGGEKICPQNQKTVSYGLTMILQSVLVLIIPFLAIGDFYSLAQMPQITQLVDGQIDPYEALPITGEEKRKIAEILTIMADNNVFQLLFQRKHLERLGREIHHVHPMRFMGTVFSDQRLVHCMRCIRRSSFKWEGFMDGFVDRIKQEAREGNVNPYVPGLANALHLNAQAIQAYVDRRDFEGLIVFLVEHTH